MFAWTNAKHDLDLDLKRKKIPRIGTFYNNILVHKSR